MRQQRELTDSSEEVEGVEGNIETSGISKPQPVVGLRAAEMRNDGSGGRGGGGVGWWWAGGGGEPDLRGGLWWWWWVGLCRDGDVGPDFLLVRWGVVCVFGESGE